MNELLQILLYVVLIGGGLTTALVLLKKYEISKQNIDTLVDILDLTDIVVSQLNLKKIEKVTIVINAVQVALEEIRDLIEEEMDIDPILTSTLEILEELGMEIDQNDVEAIDDIKEIIVVILKQYQQ